MRSKEETRLSPLHSYLCALFVVVEVRAFGQNMGENRTKTEMVQNCNMNSLVLGLQRRG